MTRAYEMELERMELLVRELADATRGIDGVLDTLDDRVAGLRGQWSGAASAAYQTAHQEWSTSLRRMSSILAEASTVTTGVVERQRAARSEVAALWS